ncbi:MAG: hypothetical protein JWP20_2400 [Roseomonas sp.]|jgi:hypothetical protein|nr:hypothetical protein [Roseomonas sp.]
MLPDEPRPQSPSAASEDLKRRARVLTLPEGEELPNLPDDRLLGSGLPPRPDKGADPELYALWHRMLTPPLRYPKVELALHHAGGPRLARIAPAGGGGAAAEMDSANMTRMGNSQNWSGAFIQAHDGGRFSAVWGNWHVPAPGEPADADPTKPPPGGQYECSTWIGLDGRRQHSVSLPQMGTLQVLKPVKGKWKPEVAVWHQWWIRNQKFPYVILKGFKLDAGDEVIATLTVVNPMRVHFTIKNQDKGDIATVGWDADSPLAPVEGSTAEWIVERPTDLKDDSILYELPDYEQVAFMGCTATMAGQSRTLEAARLIRMYKSHAGTSGTACISVPDWAAPRHRSLNVVYRGPP